ncbi:MAG: AMP-binding protein [bacterium]
MAEKTQRPSYAKTDSKTPLLEETTGRMLARIAAKYPEGDAIVAVWQGRRYTYREFHERCRRAARAFMAAGLKKGDRMAILSTNSPEWIVAQMAVPMAGGVLVSINPAFKTHELEYVLHDSDSTMLLIMESFKSSNYLGMFHEICPESKGATPGKISCAKIPLLKTAVLLGDANHPGVFTWNEFLSKAESVTGEEFARRESQLDPRDVINMQYTSGTTGFPKGVCLTHRNVINNGFFVGENLRFTSKDRLAIPVPFFHCFGMVLSNLACITHGATMVLPSEHFDALMALKAVEAERCTALHGVPTMFAAELAHPDFSKFNLSTLRTGIMAGAPCPVELMRQVNERMNMREVTICYGLTECSPVTNQTRTDDPINLRIETVGPPSPHVEVRICDPDGKTVPTGTQGEVCARGYNVMSEYYKKPAETADAIDSEGWLHSGDLGVMEDNGYVRITGRIKDMIIRGGENVYPREIEEFLYTSPKVETVAVFGVPDQKFGEQVAVWIRLRKGETATAEEIIEFCKGRIAYYKVPKYVKFVDEFPMTASGKLKKFVMREMYARELGS